MQTMLILAGGFGTRLREAVKDVPKPLAPIGSVPFLHYQIEHWIAQGATSFVFLLHHQAQLINHFIDERRSSLLKNCEVKSIIEPYPLDTGGAVAYAVRELELNGDFIVANADTWLETGVRELGSAESDTILAVWQRDASRYGSLEIDKYGFVLDFREKAVSEGAGWINAGMASLQTKHFRMWDGQRLSLEKDIFPKLLEARQLKAIQLESDFVDIGVAEDYLRFSRWHLAGRQGVICS